MDTTLLHKKIAIEEKMEELRKLHKASEELLIAADDLKEQLSKYYESTPWIASLQKKYKALGEEIEAHSNKSKKHSFNNCRSCKRLVDDRIAILDTIEKDPDAKVISKQLSDVGYKRILMVSFDIPTLKRHIDELVVGIMKVEHKGKR